MDDKFLAVQIHFNGIEFSRHTNDSVEGNSLEEIESKMKTMVPTGSDSHYWLVFEARGKHIYSPIMFLNTNNKDDIIKHDLNKHSERQ